MYGAMSMEGESKEIWHAIAQRIDGEIRELAARRIVIDIDTSRATGRCTLISRGTQKCAVGIEEEVVATHEHGHPVYRAHAQMNGGAMAIGEFVPIIR